MAFVSISGKELIAILLAREKACRQKVWRAGQLENTPREVDTDISLVPYVHENSVLCQFKEQTWAVSIVSLLLVELRG